VFVCAFVRICGFSGEVTTVVQQYMGDLQLDALRTNAAVCPILATALDEATKR
jgi:hypothetical protein